MYVSLSKDNIIRSISEQYIKLDNTNTIYTRCLDDVKKSEIIGRRAVFGKGKADPDSLRIAVICNWGDRCGIATYTKLLLDSLRPKVQEIKIFAEVLSCSSIEQDDVTRCWRRGESMVSTVKQVLAWQPDLVFIQHEFGIFPKATHFLKMLELLDKIPYVITTHSVYEHLDKSVCTAYIKNLITHSEQGRQSLIRNGHMNTVYVIPHGCVVYEDISELWNIFQNEYTIIQFGFGFNYKGVDQAIDAINHLKKSHDKFKDIFYCYMCTESPHTRNIQEEYYQHLRKKVDEYDLEENVVIVRGFLSEKHICNFLRTAKLAIFPYRNNPNNTVYGASGAIRNAMANGIPIIASNCHLFDDVEGVIPRVSDPISLAEEIDRVFSSQDYRDQLRQKNLDYVNANTWDITADRHLAVFKNILGDFDTEVVRIDSYTDVLDNV